MNTINEIAKKVFDLRNEGYALSDIDSILNLNPDHLEGCTYRDVAYRITKTKAYRKLKNNFEMCKAGMFI